MSGGEWRRDLRCHSGVTLTRRLDKVYMCETGEAGEDGDNTVSCFTADQEGEWEKLFTTGELWHLTSQIRMKCTFRQKHRQDTDAFAVQR